MWQSEISAVKSGSCLSRTACANASGVAANAAHAAKPFMKLRLVIVKFMLPLYLAGCDGATVIAPLSLIT